MLGSSSVVSEKQDGCVAGSGGSSVMLAPCVLKSCIPSEGVRV